MRTAYKNETFFCLYCIIFLFLFYRFFSQIFGRFHYFTVLALPGSMAAVIGSTILPEPVVHTYAHGMSSVAIEISINRGDFYVLKFVRNSRLLITFIFMVVNALLMHGLRENTDGGFYWLIQPTKNHFDNNEEIDAEQIGITKGKTCAHEENCYTHTFQVCIISISHLGFCFFFVC